MNVGKTLTVVLLVVLVAVAAAAGYLALQEPAEPPEFEDAGELRMEVADDWRDTGPSEEFDREAVEDHVLVYTNEFRSDEGLSTLSDDDLMLDVARSHSEDMASHGYVGHTDSDGVTAEERLSEFEPDHCTSTGENAAAVFHGVQEHDQWLEETVVNTDEEDVARSLVHSWMASELHRDNLLSEDYSSVAVGVYVSEANAAFATQKFCG